MLTTPSETGDGKAILDINGGPILPSFREGWTFGVIEIGGTDMPPVDPWVLQKRTITENGILGVEK